MVHDSRCHTTRTEGHCALIDHKSRLAGECFRLLELTRNMYRLFAKQETPKTSIAPFRCVEPGLAGRKGQPFDLTADANDGKERLAGLHAPGHTPNRNRLPAWIRTFQQFIDSQPCAGIR
jgi:hypothetical protein